MRDNFSRENFFGITDIDFFCAVDRSVESSLWWQKICAFVLHVSTVVPCVFVLYVLPRLPDSDMKVSFFFFRDGLKKSADAR